MAQHRVIRSVLMYLDRLSVATSQFLNAVLGGSPDETLSSRMARQIENPTCLPCLWMSMRLCWFLDFFERDHCAAARRRVGERSSAVLRSRMNPKGR